MKMNKMVLSVVSFFLLSSTVIYAEQAPKIDDLKNEPVITIAVDASNLKTKKLSDSASESQNVTVTIFDVASGEKLHSQQVLTNMNESIEFMPEFSKQIASQAGNVVYGVYEAIIVSDSGEITNETFSVPFVKDFNALTPVEKEEVLQNQKISLIEDFTNTLDTNIVSSTSTITPAAYISCEVIGLGAKLCVTESRNYTQPTKIGSVILGVGEKGQFNFSDTAKTKITVGVKASPTDAWTLDSTVSLGSSTSTSVDFTITGSGQSYNYHLFANYGYNYTNRDYLYNDKLVRTEYKITPTSLIGSATTPYQLYTNTGNGKPVSEITNNQWGYTFTISSTSGTSMSYEKNTSFSAGVSFVTPVGTYTGNSTSDYVNKHTISYSTATTSKFYHYDWDNTKQIFYVTKQ